MNEDAASTREQVLREAAHLISGSREGEYGDPETNLKNIAVGWEVILGTTVTPSQVAMCMVWLKTARSVPGFKWDTAVDIAGYAALYAELEQE